MTDHELAEVGLTDGADAPEGSGDSIAVSLSVFVYLSLLIVLSVLFCLWLAWLLLGLSQHSANDLPSSVAKGRDVSPSGLGETPGSGAGDAALGFPGSVASPGDRVGGEQAPDEATQQPTTESSMSDDAGSTKDAGSGDESINSPGPAPDPAVELAAVDAPRKTISLDRQQASPARAANSGSLEPGKGNVLTIPADVDSVVYVIDKSSSMMGTNFDRVNRALVAALDQLGEKQRFCVIFFDERAWCMNNEVKLVPATKKNKQQVIDWINTAFAAGGTNPVPAMEYAVAATPEPELIVVLSDGEFDPAAVTYITRINKAKRHGKRIDCVGLGEVVVTLQELAKSNKGIYYQAQ